MKIFRHLPSTYPLSRALAIGNFDGLHLGHQALLSKLVDVATQKGLRPAVMTFEPHPREFFMPGNAPARLSSMREKLEYFEDAGVQDVFVIRFDQAFSAITAQDFMQTILRKSLHASTILVGGDFCFGAKRQGTVKSFIEAGFDLIDFPPVIIEHERISSTLVRNALAAGALEKACELLGRPYSISGKVVHGAKRGRQLGYPTANVHMRHERPALTGVYAVKLSVGKLDCMNAVANLGVRPTIAGVPKLMLEVHVFDFNGNLYDKHVHVEFFHKVRDEMKFDSLDALKAQIAQDVEVAKEYFKRSI
ncbi:MAG TPA: bifunctional riboflavin kinase/FAD synthetase [Methylophilaceae bacterium]|nr:bifunctional riboflavin kinase/FAD synthetase [Methylophilaceae bacterium]